MSHYFLSICTVSILCYLWCILIPDEAARRRTWFISSLILVFCILSPVITIDPLDIERSISSFESEIDAFEEISMNKNKELMETLISERCREYIWKQTGKTYCSTLNICFQFEWENQIPYPAKAIFSGHCPADTRTAIEQVVSEDLGISKEKQVWDLN